MSARIDATLDVFGLFTPAHDDVPLQFVNRLPHLPRCSHSKASAPQHSARRIARYGLPLCTGDN